MLKGIDISKHNGVINFEILKNNIDFMIIRCAYRGISKRKLFVDETFENNIKNANEYNIPVGLYIYSTARNNKEAKEEAQFCVQLAKGYKIDYPIIIDVEDIKNQGNMAKDELSNIIAIFCKEIEKNGYYAMYYCSKDWYLNKLDQKILESYDCWIAQWNSSKCDINCGIWQYTSIGKVSGIIGNVDLNYAYKDYKVIVNNNLSKTNNIIGTMVSFDRCYDSSDSIKVLKPLYGYGKVTKFLNGARNPYLINDGDCWIKKEDIK